MLYQRAILAHLAKICHRQTSIRFIDIHTMPNGTQDVGTLVPDEFAPIRRMSRMVTGATKGHVVVSRTGVTEMMNGAICIDPGNKDPEPEPGNPPPDKEGL
jgi:hypothetical protein